MVYVLGEYKNRNQSFVFSSKKNKLLYNPIFYNFILLIYNYLTRD